MDADEEKEDDHSECWIFIIIEKITNFALQSMCGLSVRLLLISHCLTGTERLGYILRRLGDVTPIMQIHSFILFHESASQLIGGSFWRWEVYRRKSPLCFDFPLYNLRHWKSIWGSCTTKKRFNSICSDNYIFNYLIPELSHWLFRLLSTFY